MAVSSLLLPVFVQVALTLALMAWMGNLRLKALRSGAVKQADVALRQPNWPTRTMQVANCFNNQFELPVLFYVLVAFILITSTNSLVFVILAWVFVASRFVHAYIHTGNNDVEQRARALGVAYISLAAMWVIFAIRILATGA
ncbi:MAG: MAPEG family protein [Hyphomicrobium sp.]|jgi:hypothetical protein